MTTTIHSEISIDSLDGPLCATFTPPLFDEQHAELVTFLSSDRTATEVRDDLTWLARRWRRRVVIKPR